MLLGVAFPGFSPWRRLRPTLEELGVDLRRMSSGDLHTLTDSPLAGHTHNALHDVRSMAAWLRHARRQGLLSDVGTLASGPPDKDPRSAEATGTQS